MIVKYSIFNKTKLVYVDEFHNRKDGENYDEILWLERAEDYYALQSKDYRNKRVAIVTRENWIKGKLIN